MLKMLIFIEMTLTVYIYIYNNYLKYALATLMLVPHASSHNQPHPNSWEGCAADVHWNLRRAVLRAINSCHFFWFGG